MALLPSGQVKHNMYMLRKRRTCVLMSNHHRLPKHDWSVLMHWVVVLSACPSDVAPCKRNMQTCTCVCNGKAALISEGGGCYPCHYEVNNQSPGTPPRHDRTNLQANESRLPPPCTSQCAGCNGKLVFELVLAGSSLHFGGCQQPHM